MSTEILDQLGVGIIIIDLDDKIRYTNTALNRIFNIQAFNPIGMKIYDNSLPWIYGLKNPKEKLTILEARKTGAHINDTIELKLENNNVARVTNFAAPLRNKKGMLIGAISIYFNAQTAPPSDDLKNRLYGSLKKYISNNTLNHIISTLKAPTPPAAKCFITVAFIDIVGFSTMAEKLDPHETVTMLNVFFNRVHKTITKYKGDIDKYLGDAILATFFNAEACVRCFTDILLTDLPVINAQLNKLFPDMPSLGVHIGINSGWVILGEVGAHERKEITVIGDEVNTAARIQALTPPNEIWISSRTVANIGEFEKLLKEADFIKVKGKSLQIKVYKFDPTQISLDSKVLFFEKEASLSTQIIEVMQKKGINNCTYADTIEKVDKLLTKEYDSMVIGPSASPGELVSIQKIIEKVGLSNDIIIPISKDTSQKTIESLEKHGIKTYIPMSEGKQFENNLENIMRAQKINKIPMQKMIHESDSPDDGKILNADLNDENIQPEPEIKPPPKKEMKEQSLSDSIIYSKQTDRLTITITNILNSSHLIQLAGNIQKIWEYDYKSKPDMHIIVKLDSKLDDYINDDYILKIIESIFKFSKMEAKGWKDGLLIFKSNNTALTEIVKRYEEEYRVKAEAE